MKKLMCIILCSTVLVVFAQKKSVYLHTLPMQEEYQSLYTDTATICFTIIPELLIIWPSSEGDTNVNWEYFVLADTLYRDYILLDNKKYLIDSLCFTKYNNYAMAFQYTGTYCLSNNKHSYLIIKGFDGFQIGTFVQPLYMVFQKGKSEKEYHFLSSYYIENIDFYSEKILNSVKVVFKKDKIILKGINLKCVHGC
jgi:hypothetical protein